MTTHCPECGCVLVKGRSLPDHRRLFAALHRAMEQWPETHPFQPVNVDQLRAYLLVTAARHFDVAFIPAPEECATNPSIMSLFRLAVEGTAAALSRKTGYCDIRVGAGGVEILTPKSIDFRSVSQREFGPIRDDIEAAIEEIVGTKIDVLLKARAA